MLDNLLEGCQIIDFDWRYLYINKAAIAQAKQTKEGLLGRTMMEVYPGIEQTELFAVLSRCLKEREAVKLENEFIFPNGNMGWFQLSIQPVPEGIFILSFDITEQKKAEASLQAKQAQLAGLIASAMDAIISVDERQHIVIFNAGAEEMFGWPAAEAIGQPLERFIPERYRTVHSQHIQRFGQTGVTNRKMGHLDTLWALRADGQEFPIEASISQVRAGGATLYTVILRDIAARKQGEEALHQSETQLHHIIDSVPEGVLLLTADNAVRLTNPVADRFLKILAPNWANGRLTHLGSRPLSELLTSPPKGLWHEINLEEYAFETIARPVEHSPDNTGWVFVLRDITREREIQERAQRQERLAAVGHLAAGIAHDFNNIMAVIILYAQLLLRRVEMPADAQEKMHTIERQAQRATELIQQILDFSRQSVMERQPLDLVPFMKELIKLLERTLPEHIQLELDCAEDACLIQADPARIQQTIMNLAVNARDAMPEGGPLQISLDRERTDRTKQLLTAERPPGEWIQIRVADSGSGIAPDVLAHIFEPFFTTKEVGQGTGLGLAQVYGIVKQHEGYLDVQTEVAEGTTFTLSFPALEIGEQALVRLDGAELALGRGQLILVVEDHLPTRQALVSSLAFLNYEVVEASNGREALAILSSKVHDIALVLSDVVMPQMGGVALLHAMRQQKLGLPIVLLTGHPLTQEMENLQVLGLSGWLSKPPDLVNLSRLLAQALATEGH
jgi:PAS domain S-box-containing protein